MYSIMFAVFVEGGLMTSRANEPPAVSSDTRPGFKAKQPSIFLAKGRISLGKTRKLGTIFKRPNLDNKPTSRLMSGCGGDIG